MKKVSKVLRQTEVGKDKPATTVGLDLGDRYSHYCVLNEEGEVVEEGRIQSTETAFRRHFEGEPRQRVALECGTHSPWVSRLLKTLGHQVMVANARKIPAITASKSKNDRNDAELLARFAAHDPRLLSPVQHRSLERQQDLNLIQARSTLDSSPISSISGPNRHRANGSLRVRIEARDESKSKCNSNSNSNNKNMPTNEKTKTP